MGPETETDNFDEEGTPLNETGYAQARNTDRTYISKTFPNGNRYSRDHDEPSRFLYRVFDDERQASLDGNENEEWIVSSSEYKRWQIKLLISREKGSVADLWIYHVPTKESAGKIKELLHVRRDDAVRLVQFFNIVDLIDPQRTGGGIRVNDDFLAEILNDPESLQELYTSHSSKLRSVIENDSQAKDIVALAGRREVVSQFREMLSSDEYFDSLKSKNSGPESVWQSFFEENPWILGVNLGAQLYTSWSNDKLEQIVDGHSVGGDGRRVDALLQTSGLIRSMVFAEIKHHQTPLLANQSYRPSIWRLSTEVTGGISQAQVTVHQAVASLGPRLSGINQDGFDTAESTYLLRPRSFLIVGQLSEFRDTNKNHHVTKFRSFELARRHLQDPEIITFDELLARAQWIVGIK